MLKGKRKSGNSPKTQIAASRVHESTKIQAPSQTATERAEKANNLHSVINSFKNKGSFKSCF